MEEATAELLWLNQKMPRESESPRPDSTNRPEKIGAQELTAKETSKPSEEDTNVETSIEIVVEEVNATESGNKRKQGPRIRVLADQATTEKLGKETGIPTARVEAVPSAPTFPLDFKRPLPPDSTPTPLRRGQTDATSALRYHPFLPTPAPTAPPPSSSIHLAQPPVPQPSAAAGLSPSPTSAFTAGWGFGPSVNQENRNLKQQLHCQTTEFRQVREILDEALRRNRELEKSHVDLQKREAAACPATPIVRSNPRSSPRSNASLWILSPNEDPGCLASRSSGSYLWPQPGFLPTVATCCPRLPSFCKKFTAGVGSVRPVPLVDLTAEGAKSKPLVSPDPLAAALLAASDPELTFPTGTARGTLWSVPATRAPATATITTAAVVDATQPRFWRPVTLPQSPTRPQTAVSVTPLPVLVGADPVTAPVPEPEALARLRELAATPPPVAAPPGPFDVQARADNPARLLWPAPPVALTAATTEGRQRQWEEAVTPGLRNCIHAALNPPGGIGIPSEGPHRRAWDETVTPIVERALAQAREHSVATGQIGKDQIEIGLPEVARESAEILTAAKALVAMKRAPAATVTTANSLQPAKDPRIV